MSNKLGWYSKYQTKPQLDYSKPIFCKYVGDRWREDDIYLLVPEINTSPESAGYGIVGYNWVSMVTGLHASCATFETPQDAVKVRESSSYEVFNGRITIEKE